MPEGWKDGDRHNDVPTETNNHRRSTASARPGRRLLLALVSLWVLANVWWFSQSIDWRSRYLIIHADDAGMYHSVNVATIKAMEHGLVSSASIMVPCPAFQEFAQYAAAHPEKDFGVHLTLNCDTTTKRWGPVSPRGKVPSLVDADGFFWLTTGQTAEHAKLAEVDLELRTQIEAARKAGIAISHLDHHMFVLFERPDFLRLYIQLGLDYDLPVRYQSLESAPIDGGGAPAGFAQSFHDGFQLLQRNKMPIFEEVESANYGLAFSQKQAYFLKKVAILKPGVSEFVIHCADATVGGPQPPDVSSREADTHIFTSGQMAEILRKNAIQVITWKDFRRIAKR